MASIYRLADKSCILATRTLMVKTAWSLRELRHDVFDCDDGIIRRFSPKTVARLRERLADIRSRLETDDAELRSLVTSDHTGGRLEPANPVVGVPLVKMNSLSKPPVVEGFPRWKVLFKLLDFDATFYTLDGFVDAINSAYRSIEGNLKEIEGRLNRWFPEEAKA